MGFMKEKHIESHDRFVAFAAPYYKVEELELWEIFDGFVSEFDEDYGFGANRYSPWAHYEFIDTILPKHGEHDLFEYVYKEMEPYVKENIGIAFYGDWKW